MADNTYTAAGGYGALLPACDDFCRGRSTHYVSDGILDMKAVDAENDLVDDQRDDCPGARDPGAFVARILVLLS
jgi:hypothetical protein